MTRIFSLILVMIGLFSALAQAAEIKIDAGQHTTILAVSSSQSFDSSLVRLKYAANDTTRFIDTMLAVGKLDKNNIIHLKNPTIQDLEQAFKKVKAEYSSCIECTGKFIFYYTGHSEQGGLHLKDGLFVKAKLHSYLSQVSSRSKVAILDSCYAGALSRKGFTRSKPEIFFPTPQFDEPSGIVFLAASSEKESAFESSKLKGSVFTFHLIKGLAGHADTNKDGIVSIDELYTFVYKEMKPGNSLLLNAPPQQPEFIANLQGKGALAITYPASTAGQLELGEDIGGIITLIREEGLQHFEFEKELGRKKLISLPAGDYRIMVSAGPDVGYGKVEIQHRRTIRLVADEISWTARRSWHRLQAKGPAAIDTNPLWLFGVIDSQARTLTEQIFLGVEIPARDIDLWGVSALSIYDINFIRRSTHNKASVNLALRWGVKIDFEYSLFHRPQKVSLLTGAGVGLFQYRSIFHPHWMNEQRDSGLSDSFFLRINPYWEVFGIHAGIFISFDIYPGIIKSQPMFDGETNLGFSVVF